MRSLVIGGHGFVGRHLAQYLLKCGDDVVLTYHPSEKPQVFVDPNRVQIPAACQSVALDITNAAAVCQLMQVLKPEMVYHLAAITFVPDGERDFTGLFGTNTVGTYNVLDAIAKHSKKSRFLYVSSAEVYGEPRPGSLPLTENSELRPISAYGASKVAAEAIAHKYAARDGLHVVRIRPFPHLGPGQSERFAISSFASQVAKIKLGEAKPVVQVGNLEVKRDYCDVSDIVRGYHEALLNGRVGEAYNLCSGQSVQIKEILECLIKLAGVEVEVVVDAKRVRDIDLPDIYGSFEKAQSQFAWKPRVEREAMLDSLLAYWLETHSG